MVQLLAADNLQFPPVEQALREPNGLLAMGGDLEPSRLEAAYRSGIFPWYEEGQPILWWSPDPRACIRTEQLKISRSLRKRLKRREFQFTCDSVFEQVIRACAAPRSYSSGTWITPAMQAAYVQLHRLGFAHSIEVWQQGELVGGLYGVSFGSAYFGESMFSHRSDASKAGLVMLALNCDAWNIDLIDCQIPNEHLLSMGAAVVSRDDFLQTLQTTNKAITKLGPWRLAIEQFPNESTSGE